MNCADCQQDRQIATANCTHESKLHSWNRKAHRQIAKRVVDDFYSAHPSYRTAKRLESLLAVELAGHEALVSALRLAEPLLSDLCTMALRKELHAFLPRGEETLEQITAWLQSSDVTAARAALQLAEGA